MVSKHRDPRHKHGIQTFSKLIHVFFQSPEYALLSPRAVKLLIDLYCRFDGKNNGDLSAAWTLMRPVGWSSKDQLAKGIRELLESGWLCVTRQSDRKRPRLYALTFLPIDDCDGKLDVSPTRIASHTWRRPELSGIPAQSVPRRAGRIAPQHGALAAQEIGKVPRSAGQI